MSSYFDEQSGYAAKLWDITEDRDDIYFKALAAIENNVAETCSQVTNDHEFPDDLRQKIHGIIATHSIASPHHSSPNPKARERAMGGSSALIELLHDAFHEVMKRDIWARFGRFTDNPPSILARIKAEDAES